MDSTAAPPDGLPSAGSDSGSVSLSELRTGDRVRATVHGRRTVRYSGEVYSLHRGTTGEVLFARILIGPNVGRSLRWVSRRDTVEREEPTQ